MLRSSASCVVSNSTGTDGSWREEGGGPSLDLTRLHPWNALPVSAPRSSTFRVWTRLTEAVKRGRGARVTARVAAHRGRAAIHAAELLEREGAARGQAGMDLTLELDETLEMGPRRGRRGAEHPGGAQTLRRERPELVPAAV